MKVFNRPRVQKIECEDCKAIFKPSRREIRNARVFGLKCPVCGKKVKQLLFKSKDGTQRDIFI